MYHKLYESHRKETNYLFPLIYCVDVVITWLIEIIHLVLKYIDSLKKYPKMIHDEAFHNQVFICILQFLLCIVNDLEPVFKLF